MDQLRSPASASRSSFESSQASPMSMGSAASPLDPADPSGYVFITLQNSMDNMMAEDIGPPPYLEIVEQPQDKFRFRYKSEMHGTHGCILGVNKSRLKKTYPAVQLKNYTREATIRCTLYSIDDINVQHPHILVAKIGSMEKEEPHDKEVSSTVGYKVDFQGIGIIHTARKHVCATLVDKKRKLKLEALGLMPDDKLTVAQENQIREAAARESQKINLNSVCLRFEAFVKDFMGIRMLCDPVYSVPIHNMKSALTGELKICRIDKVAGSCRGGEDIYIFVEKVNKKNIKVRFFEIDEEGFETWEDYGRFTELDVHHQYAIAFRTPPYRDLHMLQNKEVYLELYRPTDGVKSECKKFTYKPQERVTLEISRKRARTELTECEEIPIEVMQPPVDILHVQEQQDYQLVGENNVMLPIILPDLEDLSGLGQMSITTNSFEQFLGCVHNFNEYSNLLQDQDHGVAHPDNGDLASDAAPSSQKNPAAMQHPTVESPMKKRSLKSVAPQILSRMQAAALTVHAADLAHVCLRIISSDYKSEENNGLHAAVLCSQLSILVKIISMITSEDGRHFGVVNKKNVKDKTPLYLSVLLEETEMVEALLKAGANPMLESNQINPLQLAVQQGSIQCLARLLPYVTTDDLSKENLAGLPLLHQAVETGNLEIVKMLINAGANPSQLDSSCGCSPLHLAVQKSTVSVVKYLLSDTRVDIDAVNAAGNTSLHIACVTHDIVSPQIFQLLLEAGANPWIENNVPMAKEDTADDTAALCEANIKKESLDETEVEHFRGQTPFDLAVNNEQIALLLRDATQKYESTAIVDQVILPLEHVELKTEAITDQHILPLENVELKTEAVSPQLEDALDESTLTEVAKILQDSSSWKDLAHLLNIEHYLPELEKHGDPALRLLTGCMGQVSTSELRELLEALEQEEAVQKIDAMLAQQS